MWWKYLELAKTLKTLYPVQKEIRTLLTSASFDVGDFDVEGRPIVIWTEIVRRLELQNRLHPLVQQALKEYPDNPVLLGVTEPEKYKQIYPQDTASLEWKTKEKGADLERIMGEQSTLLPISFLETGTKRAAAVARVVTPKSLGSGFLISADNLFITNHHVLPSKEVALKSKVQFNFQKNTDGSTAVFEEFDIDDSVFETSPVDEDDWSLVRLKGNPAHKDKYGFFKLDPAIVKKNDYVNIIQHPGGEHKQIGMYHNLVTYSDNDIIQYLTDTMPGSSGAPVLNSRWNVVALHRRGGWMEEPGTVSEVLRNEGTNINKIIAALTKKGFNI